MEHRLSHFQLTKFPQHSDFAHCIDTESHDAPPFNIDL